jgi:hypothetical protein
MVPMRDSTLLAMYLTTSYQVVILNCIADQWSHRHIVILRHTFIAGNALLQDLLLLRLREAGEL